jgi:hypothetical protein
VRDTYEASDREAFFFQGSLQVFRAQVGAQYGPQGKVESLFLVAIQEDARTKDGPAHRMRQAGVVYRLEFGRSVLDSYLLL